MSYLYEEHNLDVPWMKRLHQIRYNIDQQKNLFDVALCIIEGLKDAGFEQICIWTYNVGDDAVSKLLGLDEHGKIYSNPKESLPKDSIPPIHGYEIDINGSEIFLYKNKDEDKFSNIWGYFPPYPGYYKRDTRGDNISLRTSEERGKIILISVDTYISGCIIDQVSANFLHLVLIEMEKALVGMSLKEAVVESEAKNKAILDAIPDLMFRITKDGVFTDYKDVDRTEFYVPKEKIIGSNVKDILPLDVANQTIEYILKTLDSGAAQIYEYKLSIPKGTRDYESRMVVCGKDEVLAIIRDVTEQKQMEESLRRSEERLKKIFEYAPDAYYLCDTSGTFIDGNKNAEEMVGYEKSELIGKSFLKLKLLPPSQIPKAAALLYKNVTGHATGPDEFILIRKDRKRIPVEIRTVPIEINGQNLVLGIARDISERLKMEEKLRKSEEKYRLIFQLSPEAILTLDKKGNIQDINERPFDWIGYKSEEIIGKNILKLPFLTKKSKLIAMQSFFQRITGKEILPYELEFITKDSKKRMFGRVVANPIRNENGKIIQDLVMISDITDQKKAEIALQKAKDELEKRVEERTLELTKINEELRLEITKRKQIENALRDREEALHDQLKIEERISADLKREIGERKRTEAELARSNAELQQFAYVASHDLQEPLRMVASYLQLLEHRYKSQLDDDADDFISYAVDGAIRMQRLINDLLIYSRVSTRGKEFKPTNCQEILKQTLADLQIAIRENEATVTYDPLPIVIADDVQIGQLFQNLIGNAIKFRKAEPPNIHISAEQRDSEWVFSVRDNGIGIDLEYKDRIFVIFQRLHSMEKYPGTGIGLAVCKRIVERHNGSIWVESKPGVGSSFFFTIPIQRESDVNEK